MVVEHGAQQQRVIGLQATDVRLKQCPRCDAPKPITDFYRVRCNPDGYDRYCKVHRIEATSSYHARNKDKQRKWSAINRARNKACFEETGHSPKRHPRKRECPRCGVKRLAEEFPVNKLRSSGRESWCKYCLGPRRRSRAKRWYNGSKDFVNLIRDPLRRKMVASSPYLHGRELDLHRVRHAAYILRSLNL